MIISENLLTDAAYHDTMSTREGNVCSCLWRRIMERAKNQFRIEQYPVKVRADFTTSGVVIPVKFKEEDGEAQIVSRILDMKPCAALKSGGDGIRYTVLSGGRRYYLFRDGAYWTVQLVN